MEFKFDMADIKPSLGSVVAFALLALIVIPPLKWGLTKVHIPGVSELAGAI